MFPVLRKSGLGLLAFSPLDTGHLVPGRNIDPDTPLATLIGVLDQVAQDLRVSRATVCVAWVLTHPEVTSVLAGTETPEHVKDNFDGAEIVLPDEAIETLNIASAGYREQQAQKIC